MWSRSCKLITAFWTCSRYMMIASLRFGNEMSYRLVASCQHPDVWIQIISAYTDKCTMLTWNKVVIPCVGGAILHGSDPCMALTGHTKRLVLLPSWRFPLGCSGMCQDNCCLLTQLLGWCQSKPSWKISHKPGQQLTNALKLVSAAWTTVISCHSSSLPPRLLVNLKHNGQSHSCLTCMPFIISW